VTDPRYERRAQNLQEAQRRGFEPRDVPPRGVSFAILALFVGVGLSAALVAGLLMLFPQERERPAPTALETAPLAPPDPRLETSPGGDRLALEKAARDRLTGYAWADRRAGRVRIPIDRAVDILAEQGWPDTDDGRRGTRP
jgi:hypothetical protein